MERRETIKGRSELTQHKDRRLNVGTVIATGEGTDGIIEQQYHGRNAFMYLNL
jgi:hypothetical protein